MTKKKFSLWPFGKKNGQTEQSVEIKPEIQAQPVEEGAIEPVSDDSETAMDTGAEIEAAAEPAAAPQEEKKMGVNSPKAYPSIHRDRQEGFGPVQIVYFCWEGHMLFAPSMALVGPPEMKLGELIEGQLKNILKIDPDAAKIDWDNAQWFKRGAPVELDYNKSLAENGIGHKHQIMLKTPGLNTICGAAA